MVINRIMCTWKILTDLCFTKQKITIENASVRVVYGVLVVKCVGKTQRKLFEH